MRVGPRLSRSLRRVYADRVPGNAEGSSDRNRTAGGRLSRQCCGQVTSMVTANLASLGHRYRAPPSPRTRDPEIIIKFSY